jgi:hypothetical protein
MAKVDLPTEQEVALHHLRGERPSRRVWLDGTPLDPTASQEVLNHSPDGFEWGYGGSGPAQLALAVCLALTGDPRRALAIYQRFKSDLVSSLPAEFDVTFAFHPDTGMAMPAPRCMAPRSNGAMTAHARPSLPPPELPAQIWVLRDVATGKYVGGPLCAEGAAFTAALSASDAIRAVERLWRDHRVDCQADAVILRSGAEPGKGEPPCP